MAADLIFLSVPGLRVADVDRQATPVLFDLANHGAIAELTPTFPCVTSCVQASMWTGRPPGEHGIIANGFYHRERRAVEFWVGRNALIQQPQIWGALQNNGLTSAVWHAQNIKDAEADFIVTPAPIHEPDGTTKLWCYSKPDGLYQNLLDDGLGHFPLQHYWGPLANIESTRWILNAAAWLHERHGPNVHWIYVPHLDYAGQKFGPNSPQARAALAELDRELGAFLSKVGIASPANKPQFLIAGEYALTDVTGAVYPNRVLRETGLLRVRSEAAAEHIDFMSTPAFAMVDHQFAHVFVQAASADGRARIAREIVELFAGRPGVAAALAGANRAEVGLDHPRAGDVILIAEDTRWFAYYWWMNDEAAPPFARTVDIHNKPGYDPVELFFDPATRGIPLNADLVKGSHGVPAGSSQHRTALLSSYTLKVPVSVRDTDLATLVVGALLG